MRNDLTDVTLIVDRSGSMEATKIEAQNGINHFISEQKKEPGECLLTLVEFDNEYNFVYKGESIQNVKEYNLVPRGMTALLDAVGRSINEAGARLSNMEEKDRPGLVTFVIVTDGGENSSHEFKLDQIKQMIEHQTNVYSWKFTFLGANQDAFSNATSMGINALGVANYAAANSFAAFSSAASNVKRMRTAKSRGAEVNCSYTPEELSAMGGQN